MPLALLKHLFDIRLTVRDLVIVEQFSVQKVKHGNVSVFTAKAHIVSAVL